MMGSDYDKSDLFIKSPDLLVDTIGACEPIASSIVFCLDQETPVLKLDRDGFHYKGETIEDAGEAYKAFMEVMEMVKK